MADREIWLQANSNETFLVAGNTKKLITASGGVSQANIINGLIQTGAVDKRTTYYPPASVYALEGMKLI